jgi:hypothetical protein
MTPISRFCGIIAAAALAAYLSPLAAGNDMSRAESFEARWVAFETSGKSDRLPAPDIVGESSMITTVDLQAHMTIATKTTRALSTRGSANSMRGTSKPQDDARKSKLPVGCEPSFSPVTTPSMANVSGRCVASHATKEKLAALSR